MKIGNYPDDNELYGLILSDVIANIPAAGTVDRFFWSTDEHILYRDTGAAWVKAAVADYPDLDSIPASFTPSAHESTHVAGGGDEIDSALAIAAMANLGNTKIWQGNVGNRPVEVDFFPDLSRGHLIVIPTTGVNGTTGWTKAENSVTVDNQDTNHIKLTVANALGAEDGRAYIGTYGLCPGANAAKINWDKELFIQFTIRRVNAEATSPPLCYVQLKIANTAGALAADGLGIRIADNAADPHTNDRKLYGESYGSGGSDEVIDLGVTMSNFVQYTIGIHHKPGEFVKWHINGTLAGTQSNTNHVPTGDSGAPGFIVVSADKAATDPDAAAEFYAGWFLIWQEH